MCLKLAASSPVGLAKVKKSVTAFWRGRYLCPDCGAWIGGTGQGGYVARMSESDALYRTLPRPARRHTVLATK